jgi:hypothetical protein
MICVIADVIATLDEEGGVPGRSPAVLVALKVSAKQPAVYLRRTPPDSA